MQGVWKGVVAVGVDIFSHAGKKIGAVEGDVFKKTVKASKHFLQKPPAIAYDMASIRQAQKVGANRLLVIDSETNTKYRTSIKILLENGRKFDRGYSEQVYLVLKRWSKDNPLQMKLKV